MAATFEVPGIDFGEVAREMIAIKLTEALSTSPEGIKAIVHSALGRKVNKENGSEPRSYDRDTIPWVEFVAADLIREATKKVLAEKVESMRPSIEKAVEAEIRKSGKTIAKALVDAYANEAKHGYRLNVSMQFKAND